MSDTLLTFVHISDTHFNPDLNYSNPFSEYPPIEGTNALVESIQALPFDFDFILHTGDVIYDPHESVYETVKEVFASLEKPIYYIAGNHDHNDGLQRHLLGWEESEVIPNLHYEFEANGVQIICLDSNGPAQVPSGYVPEKQLEWLETLCTADDDRPLVIAIHHNPLAVDVPWLDDFMRIINGDALHEVIKKARSRLVGVFHGHIHQNTSVYREGILYSSVASSWVQFHSYLGMSDTTPDAGSRPGYSVVMVKPNQSFIRRYWFDVPSHLT
jgi:3',5'-cyclic-AMP phosphodiesterase